MSYTVEKSSENCTHWARNGSNVCASRIGSFFSPHERKPHTQRLSARGRNTMRCASALPLQRRTASPLRVANDPSLHYQKPKARVFQKFRKHSRTHTPITQEETRSLCKMSRGDRSLFQFSATQKPYIARLKGHQRPRTPFLSSLVSLRTDSQAPLTTLRGLEDLYSFEAVAHNAPSSATPCNAR